MRFVTCYKIFVLQYPNFIMSIWQCYVLGFISIQGTRYIICRPMFASKCGTSQWRTMPRCYWIWGWSFDPYLKMHIRMTHGWEINCSCRTIVCYLCVKANWNPVMSATLLLRNVLSIFETPNTESPVNVELVRSLFSYQMKFNWIVFNCISHAYIVCAVLLFVVNTIIFYRCNFTKTTYQSLRQRLRNISKHSKTVSKPLMYICKQRLYVLYLITFMNIKVHNVSSTQLLFFVTSYHVAFHMELMAHTHTHTHTFHTCWQRNTSGIAYFSSSRSTYRISQLLECKSAKSKLNRHLYWFAVDMSCTQCKSGRVEALVKKYLHNICGIAQWWQ